MNASAVRAHGRYDGIGSASSPGDLPREGKRRGGIHIIHGAVPEPNAALRLPEPGATGPAVIRRQRVAINANCDALEQEAKLGRISPAAYVAGRSYQRVLEVSRGHRSGSNYHEPVSRVDAESAREKQLIKSLQSARDAVALIDETRRELGQWAELVLTLVLSDGLTLGQIARNEGYKSTHGRREVARTFREGLEDLARVWGRKGWPVR